MDGTRARKLVMAALCRRDGRILLTRRRPEQPMGGLWEFPGGKLEPGELPEEGLAREIREELGVGCRVGGIHDVVAFRYPEFDLLMLVYDCVLEGTPQAVDVAELAWVVPAELPGYDVLPADRPLVEKLARAITPVVMAPIGVVSSTRREATDDRWLSETSSIELDGRRFTTDALAGLGDFSHVEVVFLMDAVDEGDVELAARHPRNRSDWPAVGIFAQRAKRRPNRIGVSRCRLLGVDGLRVRVEGLDAIDGTPVLDLKPWVAEFGPRGESHQPAWITELMKDYY
jgi:tRNA-Thr(GGU) m(6)t(6)A37 methyltransferase TsaA